MKFHIPFTISNIDRLKKKPQTFKFLIKHKKKSKLRKYLDDSDIEIDREKYLNVCFRTATAYFILLSIVTTTLLAIFKVNYFYIFGIIIGLLFAVFIFFRQVNYPKLYSNRKQKNIEKNLIPALQDISVQLNSGIPLFSIIVNISTGKYEELSKEFKKAVKRIHAGLPQVEVIEDLGKSSSSNFFKRTLWQISNGMKAGSDMAIVIQDSIKTLSEEQLIQIQQYGNKLNPLIMFYMLISVILPALSITFLTIISSLINLPRVTSLILYMGIFVFIILIQIMFMGVIRSTRPSLL